MLDFGYYNMDCMQGMKEFPDNYFDLAIVDPPYGIERLKNPRGRLEKYGDTTKANNDVPTASYFNELLRISKQSIIWGGNYFDLPPCRCFLAWYKHQPVENYSDVEMAWTTLDRPARVFDYPYFGTNGADKVRIHPTQKPVALYKWILDNYAKPGDKILDTHVGSASSLIACEDMGFKYVGFEIDKEYYRLGVERLKNHKAQVSIMELMNDWRLP